MKLSIKTVPFDDHTGWIAKCPEMGLVATANLEHAAIRKLAQLITAQIRFAESKNRLEGIFTKDL